MAGEYIIHNYTTIQNLDGGVGMLKTKYLELPPLGYFLFLFLSRLYTLGTEVLQDLFRAERWRKGL